MRASVASSAVVALALALALVMTGVAAVKISSSSSSSMQVADMPEGCKATCNTSADCTRGSLYTNPCALCDRAGLCVPVCGAGCRTDDDCRTGGSGNQCTNCNTTTRQCVNPNPLCGSFCGGVDAACVPNGGHEEAKGGVLGMGGVDDDDSCTKCSQTNWTQGCSSGGHPHDGCGVVCSGEHACAYSKTCPQCVGFYCSKPASCGQVCVSSGQCESNPGSCHACVGSVCDNNRACGASCGGSDWCGPSCPVCGHIATCVSSEQHAADTAAARANGRLEAVLAHGRHLRRQVRQAAAEATLAATPADARTAHRIATAEWLRRTEETEEKTV